MEPGNDGLEDDFRFQLDEFLVPAVNLPGCKKKQHTQPSPCKPQTQKGHLQTNQRF